MCSVLNVRCPLLVGKISAQPVLVTLHLSIQYAPLLHCESYRVLKCFCTVATWRNTSITAVVHFSFCILTMNLRCTIRVHCVRPTVRGLFVTPALWLLQSYIDIQAHCTGFTLHQLSLVDLSNPPLQLLWVLGKKLELGAVALWVFPGVIVTNFSWKMGKERKC